MKCIHICFFWQKDGCVCMCVLDFDSMLCVICFLAPAGWLGSSLPCRVTLCRAGPPTDSWGSRSSWCMFFWGLYQCRSLVHDGVWCFLMTGTAMHALTVIVLSLMEVNIKEIWQSWAKDILILAGLGSF